MARIAKRVRDKKVLKLIRRYLQAGVMKGGVVRDRDKGTPQGGPLSPLLSNIMLDAMDKELEKRGLSFCRYADDCNIYVASTRAGERVMASISRFIEGRLRLKVNREKSAVARPWERKFLGYSFTCERQTRIRVAESSIDRFKEKVKALFRGAQGRNLYWFVTETLPPPSFAAGFSITPSPRRSDSRKSWTDGFAGNCAATSGGNGRDHGRDGNGSWSGACRKKRQSVPPSTNADRGGTPALSTYASHSPKNTLIVWDSFR